MGLIQVEVQLLARNSDQKLTKELIPDFCPSNIALQSIVHNAIYLLF